VKRWFRSDGRQYIKLQCDDCGVRHGQNLIMKNHQSAVDGDEAAHLNRDIANQITYSIYTQVAKKIIDESTKPTEPQRPENDQIKRQKQYQTYMSSDAWRQKRLLVLERDLHKCQARMKGCTIKADHVHHVSYQFLGDEPLWDLQSVCVNCHRRIHN